MAKRMERNGYGRLLWSTVAVGMSVLAAGCGSMPRAVSRPIQAVSQPIRAVTEFPSKFTRKSREDAKLKQQAEKDPFPTRSEAAAKIAANVR